MTRVFRDSTRLHPIAPMIPSRKSELIKPPLFAMVRTKRGALGRERYYHCQDRVYRSRQDWESVLYTHASQS